MILKSHFILYVADQSRSSTFYESVLNKKPRLLVPGMTEFDLSDESVLGLMPKAGISRLLANDLPRAAVPDGSLRAELYLLVDNPQAYFERALTAGAQRVSDYALRDWGDRAAYCLDPDGHVLAFAQSIQTKS